MKYTIYEPLFGIHATAALAPSFRAPCPLPTLVRPVRRPCSAEV